MQYRKYGKNGPLISRLGFGVMRLPARKKGEWGSVNYTKSVKLLRSAMEMGVNLFDSHHGYHEGKSEIAIGKALKGWKGRKIYIQTKTPWYADKPREHFEKLLYEALEKLGVNSIDYLFHHAMRMDVWKKKGKQFIKFTDWAMNRGLIKNRGFSSHETPENIKKFVDTGEFASMLVSYNWMNPAAKDAIAYASSKGMGVAVMNPIGGGTLAASSPQILRLLKGSKSAAEIGLRYVLSSKGVVTGLSGMNSMEQLEENVKIASRKTLMTTLQKKNMKSSLKKIERMASKFCTGCGYCMPCPQGVDIPANFSLFNQVKFFGREEWARGQYKRLKAHDDGDKTAECCVQCGKCEPKCPNDVPIINQLGEVKSLIG